MAVDSDAFSLALIMPSDAAFARAIVAEGATVSTVIEVDDCVLVTFPARSVISTQPRYPPSVVILVVSAPGIPDA